MNIIIGSWIWFLHESQFLGLKILAWLFKSTISYLIVLIAYKCSDFVNYLTSGLYLIVNPIARFLDYLLGGYKPTRFEKKGGNKLVYFLF